VTESSRTDDSKTVAAATSAEATPAEDDVLVVADVPADGDVPEVPDSPVAADVPAAPDSPAAADVLAVADVPAVADEPEPTHHHPNLGLAPADMLAGFPLAAEELRRDEALIAARALEVAMDWDASIATRYNERARRSLLHDAELLNERLAMCISGNDPRWLAEYAEWIGPIYRRRGVPLADLAALCEGIRVATTRLEPGEAAARDRALDAAIAVFRNNGRLAGDRHKRNALLRWLYRGV
jgi:hypothetical protein